MATLTSQDNANQAIIREFNSGRRPLLALGLTPHYAVVIFGGPHGQADSSKWYAYQMPTSAFTPGAGHMFKLSNGGPVSKKWPAFYKALGDKSPSFMVPIHDQVSEYVFASFSSPSVPVLYDLIKQQTVQLPFNFSLPNSNGFKAPLSFLEDQSFGSVQSENSEKYHYCSYKFANPTIQASQGNTSKSCKYFCKQSNNTADWIYSKSDSLIQGCQETKWNIKTGFSNETHFHLVGQQEVAVFKRLDENHPNRALTVMKRQSLFSAGTDSSGRSAGLLLFGGIGAGFIVLLVLAWACLSRRLSSSSRSSSAHGRSHRHAETHSHSDKHSQSNKHGQGSSKPVNPSKTRANSKKRLPEEGRTTVRAHTLGGHGLKPKKDSPHRKSKGKTSAGKHKKRNSGKQLQQASSVAGSSVKPSKKRSHQRRSRTKQAQRSSSTCVSSCKADNKKRHKQVESTSFSTARSSASNVEVKTAHGRGPGKRQARMTPKSSIKKLPTMININMMHSKYAIKRPI